MDADKFWSGTDNAAIEFELDSAFEADDLHETVRRLEAVLKPVEPSPRFREALRLRLVRAARGERSPIQVTPAPDLTRDMLVGAALLSVAGALVYLWRSRTLQEASHVSVLLKDNSPVHQLPITAA